MPRRKKDKLEFRFYEIPHGESLIAFQGKAWTGPYGHMGIFTRHFHNLFEIGICRQGEGRLILGDNEYPYREGMITSIPANYPHNTVSEGINSWEYIFLDPDELIADLYADNPSQQEEKRFLLNKRASLLPTAQVPDLTAVSEKILEEMRLKKPYYQEVVRNLARICLLELIRIRESEPTEVVWTPQADASMNQILPALRYMDEAYRENLKAADIAKQCGLSEPHFRRVFLEQINMPPMDYLNLIRIQKACRLMNRGNASMEMVAAESGFSSVSAFTRNFRKFLDTTPYQWKLSRGRDPEDLSGYEISAFRGWESLES